MFFVKSSKKTCSNFLFPFSPFYRTFWQILHSWISVQSLRQNGIKKGLSENYQPVPSSDASKRKPKQRNVTPCKKRGSSWFDVSYTQRIHCLFFYLQKSEQESTNCLNMLHTFFRWIIIRFLSAEYYHYCWLIWILWRARYY